MSIKLQSSPTLYTYCGVETSFSPSFFSSWHDVEMLSASDRGDIHTHSPSCCIMCPLLTGSTVEPRPRQVKGTASWLSWRTGCSRWGKSRPSSQWRRRLSCPTRQSWTPQSRVGSPGPSVASLPCLCTSSPKPSSYTGWGPEEKHQINVEYHSSCLKGLFTEIKKIFFFPLMLIFLFVHIFLIHLWDSCCYSTKWEGFHL